MKINKLRTFWIITCSIWLTFIVSLRALFVAYFRSNKRIRIDQLSRNWAKKLLKIVKVKYKVFNPHGFSFEPRKPYIVMSNHASHYDIPLVYMAFPQGTIRMLVKKELCRVPIWGKAMVASEFISVDRSNGRQAIKDLERARKNMESGLILWMSPEGTRTRIDKIQKFKKGGFLLAQKTGATIIPLGIKGAGKILPAKSLNFSLGEEIELHIGKPIDTTQYSTQDRDKLMQDVKEQICALVEGSY